MIDDRRIGRFRVYPFTASLAEMGAAQRECIVLRCEFMAYMGAFDVVATHPSFDPIEGGQEPPMYDITFTKGIGGELSAAFKRIPTPIPGARQR